MNLAVGCMVLWACMFQLEVEIYLWLKLGIYLIIFHLLLTKHLVFSWCHICVFDHINSSHELAVGCMVLWASMFQLEVEIYLWLKLGI